MGGMTIMEDDTMIMGGMTIIWMMKWNMTIMEDDMTIMEEVITKSYSNPNSFYSTLLSFRIYKNYSSPSIREK